MFNDKVFFAINIWVHFSSIVKIKQNCETVLPWIEDQENTDLWLEIVSSYVYQFSSVPKLNSNTVWMHDCSLGKNIEKIPNYISSMVKFFVINI